MGNTRDYYADLEISPGADTAEIKKQYRKLALKYHPDRNPGREEAANAQFQIIQAAHDILTDTQERAKYDSTRKAGAGRYPAASGVRGNPWSHVSQQYPEPPRRQNQTPRNPTSGADRWNQRFSTGRPPTARASGATGSSAETKKATASAFEKMRTKPQSGTKAPPPPTPPRSEYARQRAEASFGASKSRTTSRSSSAYMPSASGSGDEPPVSNSNYSTRREPPVYAHPVPEEKPQHIPMPDPLRQFREDNFADPRKSSPYTTHGGERTNPFDGTNLGRSKSTREPHSHSGYSSDEVPPGRRPRSTTDSNGPSMSSSSAKTESTEHTQARPPNQAEAQTSHKPFAEAKVPTKKPSMYEPPYYNSKFTTFFSCPPYTDGLRNKSLDPTKASIHCCGPDCFDGPVSPRELTPSGGPISLTSFERHQRKLLSHLISNAANKHPFKKRKNHPGTLNVANNADYSFNISDSDDEPPPKTFAKSSVDDINTSFVNDSGKDRWEFNAGGSDQTQPSQTQPQQSTDSPEPAQAQPTEHSADGVNGSTQGQAFGDQGFHADGWGGKFGPETFVPPSRNGTSGSPSKTTRTNSRKSKTTKAPNGDNVIVIDDSSDDDTFTWRGRKSQPSATVADSPQAMDIDSPRAESSPPPPVNEPRNIPVEPTRPEWRSGDRAGADQPPTTPTPKAPKAYSNAVGSEDSEEFKASLADLRSASPLQHEKSGLKSFGEMKDNLPFESKAGDEAPLNGVPHPQPLAFPEAPQAPRLPPTVAVSGLQPNMSSWEKYASEFESYMKEWDLFQSKVTDHFATRMSHIAQSRSSKGYTFLRRSEDDCLDYFKSVQQDNDVRRRWNRECEQHEDRLREFMAFREKMK